MNLPVYEQNLHFLRKTYYMCPLTRHVGLTELRTKINSILPALPLSDLLLLLEETFDSTISNSSVHIEFKIFVTSSISLPTLCKMATGRMGHGLRKNGHTICPRSMVTGPKYDISFQTPPQDDTSST
jgi:hypothetical protein